VIYVASPYTHPDPAVREQRFDAACRAAAALIGRGNTVFSPVAHSHPLCRFGLPGDWQFWQRQDLALLAACDEAVVLKLDGWQQSRGVQAEIAAAKALGKPVRFLEPKDLCVEPAAA
jgi:nucleoside 2-deoxyribosyltransferase